MGKMPNTKQAKQEKDYRPSVKIMMALAALLAIGLLFEAGARAVYVYRDGIQDLPLVSGILQQSLSLNPYQRASNQGGHHWLLRPGYKATQIDLVAQKKKAGRDIGASTMQPGPIDRGHKDLAVFQINVDGFKGPELDHSHTRPRILALGDSTTFGIGAYDYTRPLETILNKRGIPAEVINAGVEGYSPRNLLYEIERYKALKPKIVTIFIGWNPLFFYVPWNDAWENRLRAIWLYKSAARTLKAKFEDPRVDAERFFYRDLKPDRLAPDVQALHDYTPPFLNRIERLVNEFKSIGTRVTLVTLPGLFTMSAKPSPQALKIGHLPQFTENPFVLAKLTERYNIALRALAKQRDLGLIDLEKWSVLALQPREAFFSDSVHLTPRGMDLIGSYMAEQLADQLLKK
jgi:lysophospholipase L1-like esterase